MSMNPDLHNENESEQTSDLLRKAAAGDEVARSQLFEQHRERLARMVRLRLSRQLQGRVDEEDILQETFLNATRKLNDYLENPEAPFFLWLRSLAGLKLNEIHRTHLGVQKRDADREVSLYYGALPEANSMSLAAHLLGTMTSPSQAAMKTERRMKLQETLNSMDPIDREILALRHFEQLSNAEVATELRLSTSGATARHMRALKRLRSLLESSPDFF
jgi:RNA polymerase sigma-70 factor (ECF subfamily)